MRYLIYAYPDYYPSGGMRDLVFATNDKEEALLVFNDIINDKADLEKCYNSVKKVYDTLEKSECYMNIDNSSNINEAHILDVCEMRIIKKIY